MTFEHGYGFYFSGGKDGTFTPASIFSGGEPGGYYDPGDLATVWQDSARTTPGVVGQPVGALDDKSGNGNHLLQATAGSRPILRLSGGFYHLEFDGVDDFVQRAFTIPQPLTRVSAFGSVWANGTQVFDGAGGGALYTAALFQGFGANNAIMFAGSVGPLINIPTAAFQVVTENFDGASSRIRRNRAAYATADAGSALAPGGLTVGAKNNGFENSTITAGRLILVGRNLTDPETTSAEDWCAAGSGVVL